MIINNNYTITPFKGIQSSKNYNKPTSCNTENITSAPEWLGKDLLYNSNNYKNNISIDNLQGIIMSELDIIERGDKNIYENLFGEFLENENNITGLGDLIKKIEINIKEIEQSKINAIKDKNGNINEKADELTVNLLNFRYGYDLSGINKTDWNTLNSYGVKLNEYIRAKNDAYCALTDNDMIIDNTNQHIFMTEEQKQIYKKMADTDKKYIIYNGTDKYTDNKEFLNTTSGILYGLAINSSDKELINNLQNMSEDEIFNKLRNNFEENQDNNFGIDTNNLIKFFEQKTVQPSLNKDITDLYENDTEFQNKWNTFCSKNNQHYSSMCKELIMSDVGFIQALAVNSNNNGLKKNLQNMSKEEIFQQLKQEFNENSPKNYGIDTTKLIDFFDRKTSDTPITSNTNNVGGGDKVVHEANKELANLFDRNSEFKNNWESFCLKNNTFNEYFKLCDTYIADYDNKINNEQIKTPIENIEHLIFRTIERDGSIGFDKENNPISIIDEFAELSKKNNNELDIISKKDIQCIKLSNDMVLSLENSKNSNENKTFHTIEYNSNDWDKMPYLPH